MILSRFNLKNIDAGIVSVPAESMFSLPEKVLQFGTGVLLRGLPDYFIDKANRKGIFNGRIVVVKSTDGGDAAAFDKQDGLYTLCMRGLINGQPVSENVISSAISRVLSAGKEWEAILECAHNPDLTIIISNTTEVGIELVNDDIRRYPPVSYPGKLLAFLYERYKFFQGSPESGMVIVPTELISDNGKKLEAIVLEQAHLNGLEENFIEWLEQNSHFCNSLVDRIVPGKPAPAIKTALESELGYEDDLVTMSEVYSLWAIEGNERVKEVLSFAGVNSGVVITNDITLFKELKLRLLNGTHTLSCGVAFLAGFTTVKEAMNDTLISNFLKELMLDEIAMAIPYPIPEKDAKEFAAKVIDRFSNPSIEHQWISITLNYTSKLKMRVVQVLQSYFELYNVVPEKLAIGFAAWLLFMKAVKKEGNVYFGELNGQPYPIKDEMAGYFFDKWQNLSTEILVKTVLSDASLWDADLTGIPGFAEKVTANLRQMMEQGMLATIQNENVKTEQPII
ncbi:MAG: Tagaturonate reductase [Ferruginibacter sp.]|nr:Tagaturonate reductase [Ferruginibacter sp.]